LPMPGGPQMNTGRFFVIACEIRDFALFGESVRAVSI